MIEIPTAVVIAFCALGGLLITIGGIVVRQAVAMTRNDSSVRAARAIADEARSGVITTNALVLQTVKDLAEFRERVAREYASRENIREVEGRIMTAIERLGDRFDKYVDKEK